MGSRKLIQAASGFFHFSDIQRTIMKTHQSDLSSMTIDQNEAESILEEINDYLTTIYPYKKQAAYLCNKIKAGDKSFRIMAQRKKYDIYLRFGHTWASDECKSIVIARIGFEKQLRGHGTALLETLASIAEKYHYAFLAIESVNENSKAFAGRLGFYAHPLPKCYVISTQALNASLHARKVLC